MSEPNHVHAERHTAAPVAPSAPEPTRAIPRETLTEDVAEACPELLQGYAMGGLLFVSLILGAMFGSLIAGERGASIGCIVAPTLLALFWLR